MVWLLSSLHLGEEYNGNPLQPSQGSLLIIPLNCLSWSLERSLINCRRNLEAFGRKGPQPCSLISLGGPVWVDQSVQETHQDSSNRNIPKKWGMGRGGYYPWHIPDKGYFRKNKNKNKIEHMAETGMPSGSRYWWHSVVVLEQRLSVWTWDTLWFRYEVSLQDGHAFAVRAGLVLNKGIQWEQKSKAVM